MIIFKCHISAPNKPTIGMALKVRFAYTFVSYLKKKKKFLNKWLKQNSII